ncbi:inverse autotransporter beta-barrel domain-containing protein [Xenorhabdus mauleonii]|uniref:Inverse autotransporter beta-barrel domain-containing protein n=1 Tax=Xenorhabdus mauleonii TaxID=351675 RepID=A0A1I3HUI1_9GAMM|nr:hypothetical protein [Xenorhabdus mauleonii]PHM40266.1 inverse autotransporter beta-barrel domain-containing protein [Xenorhabdus mauleonii]SFI39408.1 hypothetical protein SAMN05421680_10175 [Xenorhabdus mauleonii]
MFSYKKRFVGYFIVLISLFFSLFIKAYSNSSIATEHLGNDKQKDPFPISIKVDQSKPLLVHETYTYTATVINDNGSGNEVNWHLEKDGKPVQSIPGVTLKPVPQNDDDKQKGQYRATLTGSEAVSGVVVTAAIGSNKPTRTPVVEFKWPTIKKPTTNLNSGSISGNGGGAYPFTAEILGADGITPYTGKEIAFEWIVKHPEPTNLNNDETMLSPKPVPITEVKDGKLATSLISYQYPAVKGANVCLQVVGKDATRQCSDQVSFKEVPLKLEVGNVVLYSTITSAGEKKYEQRQPIPVLDGNGSDRYKFRALINRVVDSKIQKGRVPFKNSINLGNVNWSRNLADASAHINKNDLPDVQSLGDKTDEHGYLYGTLKSNVGIEKDIQVNVKYTSTGLAAKNKTEQDNYVRFNSVYKQGALLVYYRDLDQDSSTYKQVIAQNAFQDDNHPYNFFDTLKAHLIGSNDQSSIQGALGGLDTFEYSTNNQDVVDLGENNAGPISFKKAGQARILAKVTTPDGKTDRYYYNVKTVRKLYYPKDHPASYPLDDNNSCDNIDSNQYRSLTFSDFNGGASPIHSEFKNIFNWGVFITFNGISSSVTPGQYFIKIKDDSKPGNPYAIYDASTNSITTDPDDLDNSTGGLLLCTYN